jgi:hypothetical protein
MVNQQNVVVLLVPAVRGVLAGCKIEYISRLPVAYTTAIVANSQGIVPTKRCQKLGMLVDAVNEATLKENST